MKVPLGVPSPIPLVEVVAVVDDLHMSPVPYMGTGLATPSPHTDFQLPPKATAAHFATVAAASWAVP